MSLLIRIKLKSLCNFELRGASREPPGRLPGVAWRLSRVSPGQPPGGAPRRPPRSPPGCLVTRIKLKLLCKRLSWTPRGGRPVVSQDTVTRGFRPGFRPQVDRLLRV